MGEDGGAVFVINFIQTRDLNFSYLIAIVAIDYYSYRY